MPHGPSVSDSLEKQVLGSELFS